MKTPSENASKRSCLIWSLLFLVVLPCSLLAIGLLLWFGRETSGKSQLKARIASITKQGYPVDDATCEAFYLERTDPTHTSEWLELLAAIQGKEFTTSTSGIPILGIADEPPRDLDSVWQQEKIARNFLTQWKSLVADSFRLSADAKPVRFPIVFDSFNTIDTNRMQAMRNIGRLILLQGTVDLRDKNSGGVRDAINGMMGLSRVNSGEPMIVSALASSAIDGMAMGLLKDALQIDALSEADLQFLLPKVLVLSTIGKDWETANAGERALALPLFTDRKKARSAGTTFVFSNSRDAILYVDLMQAVLDVPTDDLVEFQAKLQAIENNLQTKARRSWLTQLDSIMTMQTAPAVSAAGGVFIRRAMQHRIAASAIGLRLYHKKYGKFPVELKELETVGVKWEQLLPSKSKSFGYRSEDKNARLWGGTLRDAHAIPAEPPIVEQDPAGVDTNGAGFWTWELPVR